MKRSASEWKSIILLMSISTARINDTSYEWPNTFAAIMVPNGGY